jgi:hypothetical protein
MTSKDQGGAHRPSPSKDERQLHLLHHAWAFIHTVYNTVNAALWALLIAGSAFLLLHIPQMREARAIAEAQRVQELSEQNKFYCEKWGMPARSHEHLICTMDLDHIRTEVEQRIADDSGFQ